ncbi:MAG TPA: bifunctional riboflavin kinase/FAD synthetase [Phycisphaerae bacterium]|nr:bifunctional riboflavin kinase/FAD synthetase [Phycisphaerae bacterium]HRW55368.1 bifunctional riboflavin kinase/FAD synthetase [Phycisphaerae bacterium]
MTDVKIYDSVAELDASHRGAVLTVGNFDGVHLGHQRILRTARALAHVSSSSVIAMTFEPHPLTLLRPEVAPARLTPWKEKTRYLGRAGADAVVRLQTDWPLLSIPAEDFVREILVKRIHPSYIVEGPDFGFGRDRAGTVETLEAMSERGGYRVHIVEPYRLTVGDASFVVSSTHVRECVARGDVQTATLCLGRPYTLTGRVMHGEAEGRKLGYPTINLEIPDQLLPGEGVYAGVSEIEGRRRVAAISVGHRPTLGGSGVVVEAFLLSESADLYHKLVHLEFHTFIRRQRRFDSRSELTAQIADDIEKVKAAITPERLAGDESTSD